MIRERVIVLLLASEAVVTAYVALVVYLISVWMVNDSAAFQMVTVDWVKTGLGPVRGRSFDRDRNYG